MNATRALLLLILLWPLLVAAAVALRPLRRFARPAVPWVALPALLLAVAAPETELRLPWVLLGALLSLDEGSRSYLAAAALLWLVAGWMSRRAMASDIRCAILLPLATAGGVLLPLAGNLSLFAAGTALTGYALCGLIAGGRGAGALLVLLVVGDLVLFELLLLMTHIVPGLEFTLLQGRWQFSDERWELLLLLLVAFGARAGIAGLHFWLAPTLATGVSLRPAVVAFVLSAGLLPWLRLLPSGPSPWTEAGDALQWVALAAAGYGIVTGLAQRHSAAVLAYAATTLAALIPYLFGVTLRRPEEAAAFATLLPAAVIQWSLALAALLVSTPPRPLPMEQGSAASLLSRGGANPGPLITLLAATLFVLPPLVLATRAGGALPLVPAVGIALLTGRALSVTTGARERERQAIAALLTLAALFVAFTAGEWSIPWQAGAAALAALLLGWLSPAVTGRGLLLAPGDLVVPLARLSSRVIDRTRTLALGPLAASRDSVQATLARTGVGRGWLPQVLRAERFLRRWPVAATLFLLLGLVVALTAWRP